MSLQERFDKVFEEFADGKLSREAYAQSVRDIYEWLPKHYREFLDKRVGGRRDVRDLGEFALHLYDTTLREKRLVTAWAALFPDVTLIDHGIANDGRLVLSARGGKSRTTDYMLRSEKGLFPLEVKFGPCRKHATYKVVDLENYLEQPGIHVLTILWPTGTGWDGNAMPEGLLWYCMRIPHLRRLLTEGERGHHDGFGGKETVRIHARDFERFFRVHRWGENPKQVRRRRKAVHNRVEGRA